jgi:hypothetical protein
MIPRLRLRRVISLAFVFLVSHLVKLLLVLNLPLFFFVKEATHYDGFLIILLVICPAPLH